jgi:tyrosyl-tRNA synthetase
MPEHRLAAATGIVDLLVGTSLAPSKGEARRLIAGGGVRVDSEKIDSVDFTLQPGGEHIVQVGRRKFIKLVS